MAIRVDQRLIDALKNQPPHTGGIGVIGIASYTKEGPDALTSLYDINNRIFGVGGQAFADHLSSHIFGFYQLPVVLWDDDGHHDMLLFFPWSKERLEALGHILPDWAVINFGGPEELDGVEDSDRYYQSLERELKGVNDGLSWCEGYAEEDPRVEENGICFKPDQAAEFDRIAVMLLEAINE